MNKKIFLLIAAFLLILNTFAQNTKAIEQIWKGKYENAQKNIEKGLKKNYLDVEFNFYKAYLLFQNQYEGYDPVQSYKCLEICIDNYPQLDDKTKEKLNTIPLNMEKFESYIDTVCRFALNDAERLNTYEAYANYLSFFRRANAEYRKEAQMYRNIEIYKTVRKTDTEEAYANFIVSYPDAQQVIDATNRRNVKGFQLAKEQNTIDSYEAYIKKYPDAAQADSARENIYNIALDFAIKENTSAALKAYMEKYPKSSQYYKAEMLYDEKLYNEKTASGNCYAYYQFANDYPNSKWFSVALNSALQCAGNDIQIIKFCYNKLSGVQKNKALEQYYNIIASDGELVSLKHFYENLNDSERKLIQAQYSADSAIAVMGDKLKLANTYNPKKAAAYDEYIKAAAPKEKAFVALQKMIQADVNAGNWSNATVTILKYRDLWKDKSNRIDNLLELIASTATPLSAEALPETINTSGNEYNPIISADGASLFFCGEGRNDNKKGEDIFLSTVSEEGWQQAQLISEISTSANDYPQCLNTAGNVLYILKNGRLYFSKKAGATWGKAQRMSSNVNTCNWQGDAFISADGQALFFAAKRNDMMNIFNDADFDALDYHGKIDEPQTDLYVCTVNGEGEWSKPINLGSTINTMYSERTPYLHADGKHLYFASDGHGGFGGLDMFVSTRTSEDCWDCWSEPVNLGKEINSGKDEMGYKITTDGTKAFFSKSNAVKGKKGNFDIYFVNLPENLQPQNIK